MAVCMETLDSFSVAILERENIPVLERFISTFRLGITLTPRWYFAEQDRILSWIFALSNAVAVANATLHHHRADNSVKKHKTKGQVESAVCCMSKLKLPVELTAVYSLHA
jgi:hypothetical protein